MHLISVLRDQKGQSQLMAVTVMGLVLTLAAAFALNMASQLSKTQVRTAKLSSARVALDAAIKTAAYIYRYEAACDQVVLNDKLSQILPDGTLMDFYASGPTDIRGGGSCDLPDAPPTCRQIKVNVGGDNFQVNFGPVVSAPFDGNAIANSAGLQSDLNRGYSQDVMVEVWTTFTGNRAIQRAVLMNTCTYPCAQQDASSSSGICQTAWDTAHSYHAVDLSARPGPPAQVSGRNLGSVVGSAGVVDMRDLFLFRNYLRSGETEAGFTAAAADVNLDQTIDERDFGLMEKLMRGYITVLPTRCGYTGGCGATN